MHQITNLPQQKEHLLQRVPSVSQANLLQQYATGTSVATGNIRRDGNKVRNLAKNVFALIHNRLLICYLSLITLSKVRQAFCYANY